MLILFVLSVLQLLIATGAFVLYMYRLFTHNPATDEPLATFVSAFLLAVAGLFVCFWLQW